MHSCFMTQILDAKTMEEQTMSSCQVHKFKFFKTVYIMLLQKALAYSTSFLHIFKWEFPTKKSSESFSWKRFFQQNLWQHLSVECVGSVSRLLAVAKSSMQKMFYLRFISERRYARLYYYIRIKSLSDRPLQMIFKSHDHQSRGIYGLYRYFLILYYGY